MSLARLLSTLGLAACLALCACGGGGSSTGGTTQTPPPQSIPEVLYGAGPQGLSSYSIDASTGRLSLVSSFAGTNFGGEPVVTSSGKFVFASALVTPGIEAFSVGSNGSLSAIAGSPFPIPAPNFVVGRIAVDPAARFLFTTDPVFSHLAVYTIGATGALTALNTTFSTGPAGSSPSAVVTDPAGKFLFTANQAGNSLAAFTIDSATGNLNAIPGSPFATSAGMPVPIVVHPSGKFLYTGLTQVGGIDGFAIDSQTGALTKMPGSPFLPQPLPCIGFCSLALTPSGKFLYTVTITNTGTPVISAYSVDSTTGVLTQITGSPFATPPPPSVPKSPCGPQNPLAVDLSGTLLYVSCANPAVMVFSINATTGAITPVAGDPNSNFGAATFQTNGANSALTLGALP